MYLPNGPWKNATSETATANPEVAVIRITPQCVMKINHEPIPNVSMFKTIEDIKVPAQPINIKDLKSNKGRLERFLCQQVTQKSDVLSCSKENIFNRNSFLKYFFTFPILFANYFGLIY